MTGTWLPQFLGLAVRLQEPPIIYLRAHCLPNPQDSIRALSVLAPTHPTTSAFDLQYYLSNSPNAFPHSTFPRRHQEASPPCKGSFTEKTNEPRRAPRVMEELQARHRKEQRDLQAKVTQKKKSATKKTRKGVNDECAELERGLLERQQAELAACRGGTGSEAADESEEDQIRSEGPFQPPGRAATEDGADELNDNLPGTSASDTVNGPQPPRKPNRQKARLAKRAAEKEALAAEAAQEATALPDLRKVERAAMVKEFERYGLKEREIRPDGHCLYSAVADQLKQIGVGLTPRVSAKVVDDETTTDRRELADYKIVRCAAADFIARHPDDFVPFLEEPLDDYTHKIHETAEWGGQLELLALAKAYGVEIHVLQSASRLEKIVPDTSAEGKTIWLAYYRHHFGLGEHYNSLRKAP